MTCVTFAASSASLCVTSRGMVGYGVVCRGEATVLGRSNEFKIQFSHSTKFKCLIVVHAVTPRVNYKIRN